MNNHFTQLNRTLPTLPILAGGFLGILSASAEPLSFYTRTGFGAMDPANANLWGDSNKTNSSVIFEVYIDYTQTVAEATAPFTLFENGADAVGSGVAISGENIIFAAGGSSIANTAVATGVHGLVAGQTNVQILAVLEFSGGTDTNELLSLYVNGELVASADNPTGNDWAGVNNSNLGTSDSFNIFEFVPSLNPNAGNNANGVFAGAFPDTTTTISFAAYELGVGDNTVENLLASPPVGALELSILPSETTPGTLDFSWTGADGSLYNLVSSTDLSTPINSWPVWEGNADIMGTGTPTILTDVPASSDLTRFFAVVRQD